MPFAKLVFPYITIQIINLVICLIATYIFYFKIKVNDIIKTFILFGAPFIYVYKLQLKILKYIKLNNTLLVIVN